MRKYTVLLSLFAAVFFSASPALHSEPRLSEEMKISMLIDYVRTLNGAVFIRNGSEYPPDQAAEHLSMKRKKAGTRVKSAADFIEKVASESYLSGKTYTVRLADGSIVRAKDLLLRRLSEIERRQ